MMVTPKKSKQSSSESVASDHSAVLPVSASASTYAAAAQSHATQRGYDADLRHFKAAGGTIPASAEMVADYLAACAGKAAVATLQHRLIAIHRAHLDRNFPSPVLDRAVKRTMQGIRRTFGVAQRRVKALVKEDILEMIFFVETQKPLRAARDKALILIGFAGAFRRSELVALRVEDMTQFDNGIELLLRRSKTDQEGGGRTVFIPYAKSRRCPVKALKAWLELAGIDSGPLFRQISRHDRIVGSRGLTGQTVALIIKAAVRSMSGVEAAKAVSGHSLRAGYCTEAATVGLQPYQIREQTGHKSDLILALYVRPVAKRKIPSLL